MRPWDEENNQRNVGIEPCCYKRKFYEYKNNQVNGAAFAHTRMGTDLPSVARPGDAGIWKQRDD